MKLKIKTTVGVFLGCAWIASFGAFAHASSAHPEKSFLLSMDLTLSTTPLSEVLTEIAGQAQIKNGYLSLGESHLEDESTHPLQKIFAQAYLSNTQNQPVKFCSEKIESFLESNEGQWLQQNVQSTEVYLGNSPATTDFTRCASSSFDHTITYSGFFHQNAFARAFPEVFPPTSVITQNGNNIRDQMGSEKGLFISQIEFPVVELFETARILKLAKTSEQAMTDEITRITQKSGDLRAKMQDLLPDTSPFAHKFGIFINQKIFQASQLPVLDSHAYLLITDLEFRRNRPSFYFLNQLLALPSADRIKLVNLLATMKYYFTQTDIPTRRDGVPSQMNFMRIPRTFSGEVAQVSFIKNGHESLMIVMSADDAELSCFVYPADLNADAVETPCSQALQL